MSIDLLFVSGAAREIDCRPRDISDLFYARVLDDERCPIVSNRRVIPRDYLPEIRAAIQERSRNREGASA